MEAPAEEAKAAEPDVVTLAAEDSNSADGGAMNVGSPPPVEEAIVAQPGVVPPLAEEAMVAKSGCVPASVNNI